MIKIVAEGLIGSGKSTILEEFRKKGYQIEKQRVEEWSLLKPFYSDPKRYAYPLQKQVQTSYTNIVEKISKCFDKGFTFLESFGLSSLYMFTKMLRDDGLLTNQEFEEIKSMVKKFKPSLLIIVDVTVETSLKRIKGRKRPGEENITYSYLERLKKYLEDFTEEFKHCFPIITVNNDEDFGQEKIVNWIEQRYLQDSLFDISLEGKPGAGKTKLGYHMNVNFLEQIITDNIQMLLEERYEKGKVFKLQEAYIKMYADQLKNCSKDKYNCWESPLSLIYVFCKAALIRGELTADEYKRLKQMYYRAGLPHIRDFRLVQYSNPTISQHLFRIKERGRSGEDKIVSSYLETLGKLYWKLLEKAGDRLLIIDNTDMTSEEVEEKVYQKLQEVYFL
jgi:deoxyadenosine/deoxycytidine kinase